MATEITADSLKKARLTLGWTQTEFADFLGVNRSFYSRIEGGAKISETTAAKIARVLESKPAVDIEAKEPDISYRKAQAGRLSATHTRSQLRILMGKLVDELPDGDYDIFEVEGASMERTLAQGDRLICKREKLSEVKENRILVLVVDRPEMTEYRTSKIWVKRCSYRKTNGYLSCKSDNPETTEPFSTFRLKESEVSEVWYPVLRITGQLSDPNRDIYDRLDEIEGRLEMLESISDIN